MSESYENLTLVETPEKIIVHPSNYGTNDKFIVINRVTDEISLSSNRSEIPDGDRIRTVSIGGIIGVINLVAGPYLLVIKTKVRVGQVSNHVIWKMNQYELIPFRKSLLHLNQQQVGHNKIYIEMLETALDTPSFYYSHTYDLTHNIQSLDVNSPDFLRRSLVQRAETKFMWNNGLLEKFQGNVEFHKFCIVLLHGFISIQTMSVNEKQFNFIVISRRSCKRPGVRLFSRGIDTDGNVSNFVETEQIVEHGSDMASYVQIRGSIPLFWTQKPNLKYKPKPTLAQTNHMEAFVKHFEELALKYHRIVCVNLVNQTGSEGVLEEAFKQYANSSGLSQMRYEGFDFHHECRNMNWDRLDILTNRVSQEIEDFSYFLRSKGQQQHQEGVFRTNCIDCLDRTNVVQGMLAKINLDRVLKRLGILGEHENIARHADMEYLFKNIWADNGDYCSIQYSGTGALKTDFTRTGKRTWVGPLRDGYNSVVRYFKNNFLDGFRQDAIDLLLCNYRVTEDEGKTRMSPLEKERDWKYYTLPVLMIFSFVMWTMLLILPSEYTSEYLLYILFWGSMVMATGGVIFNTGHDFVDKPVLSEAHRLAM